MNYSEFYKKICESSADDWNVIVCAGGNAGPSYREEITPYLESMMMELRSGKPETWPGRSHGYIAAYKPDLSITLAWGLRLDEQSIDEDWINNFADKRGYVDCVDLFYNNGLVERVRYVSVDGGRCSLPKPRFPTVEVKQSDVDLVRIVALLTTNSADYDEYLRQAGFQIVG